MMAGQLAEAVEPRHGITQHRGDQRRINRERLDLFRRRAEARGGPYR
jgi:hypothetical protein